MDNFFGSLVYGRNNRYRSIIAEGSLIPILITPDFDILSGEFVRQKSIRVHEYCVTRVGFVISRVRP